MTTRGTGGPLRPAEASQRVSYLELFFDLALVFGLFQLSHLLLQQLHWSGALQALILLLAVWRIWVVTTWSTNLLDPRWPVVQRVVIGTLLGSVVLAAALPQAFGTYGLTFAGVFVAVQAGREIFLVAALRGSDVCRVVERALLWAIVSALPWIAGAFTHATARAVLWTLAVGIDYAALALAFLRRGATGPAPVSAPLREAPGRLRVPRSGQRPPRPVHRPTTQAEEERCTRTGRRLRDHAQSPVLPTHPRRTRHRINQVVVHLRFTGRRDTLPDIIRAVTGLAADRAATW